MMGTGCRLDRENAKNSIARGIARGMGSALAVLEAASRAQAPRDTGRLLASCGVRRSGDGQGGAVGYGAAYAPIQHENTALNHSGGRKAKFLADPAADPAVQEAMLQALAAGCRGEMR